VALKEVIALLVDFDGIVGEAVPLLRSTLANAKV
jgi:hypothetical protein